MEKLPFACRLVLDDAVDGSPPLPNLTVQDSFSDESAYSSQVSGEVPPASKSVAIDAEEREDLESAIIVESSDADGDENRESRVVPAQEEDQLPANVAPLFRIRRRKKEDRATQPPPKKLKRGKTGSNPEGLTVKKPTGSKHTAASRKAEETADLLCNLEAVVTYSPGFKKRRGSPARSSSPRRSRSPSPDLAGSCSMKQPVTEHSKLLIRHLSQGEHSDHKAGAVPSDCAPFSQLLHIQQMSDSENEWLESVKTSSCVREDANRDARITDCPSQRSDCRFPLLLERTDSQLPVPILLQLPKALEQLKALCVSHPSIDMHRLFTRCVASTGRVYTQELGLCDSAQPEPHGRKHSAVQEGRSMPHRKKKRQKQRHQQSEPVTDVLELKCSINVQQMRVGDKKVLIAHSISPMTQPSDGMDRRASVDVLTLVGTSDLVENKPARDEPVVVNLCSPEQGFPSSTVSSGPSKQTTEHSNVMESMQSFDHWSSALAPQKSSDVLGNSSAVLGIMSWMQLWKTRLHSSATTRSTTTGKAAGEKGNGAVAINVLDTSDSDFESPVKRASHSRAQKRQRMEESDSDWMAGDDEEEEEEDLYKVMLLMGPSGSGKTAAVYACAQELGYKVLEMNASSQRSRSQVMSHLMEASLSHQVKTSGTLSTFFAPSTQPKADHRPAGNKSKAASRGITSFFKPVGPKGSADKEKPRSDGRTCTESSDGGAASKSQKKVVAANPGCANVHLAKTGLILLEDVDVLFDEHDGGFWSAVYDVIETSRKPIIMTTTDEAFELGCDCLQVVFSAPSSNDLSAYLQTLALSQGLQLSEAECTAMADLQHRDIRRCIMNAQLWFNSAATTHAPNKESKAGPDSHSREKALPSSKLKDGRHTNRRVSWLLTGQLGVEVCGETSDSVSNEENSSDLGMSVGAAHLCAQKHSAIQQQGIDVIYHLYEEQLRRMGDSHTDSSSRGSSLPLSKEQIGVSQTDAAVKEQLKALLWCSSQMSSLDIISDARCKKRSHPSNFTPWWSVSQQDSLVDDHSDTAVDSQVLSDISSLADVLLLDLVKSRAALQSTVPQVDTLTELGSVKALTSSIALRHNLSVATQRQMDSWESCSPLFSRSHHVSHRVVSLDMLPWLRNMCTAEQRRKEARLKRRFQHYFHYSPLEEDALHALPEQSGLSV